ncbi:hypothetical protein E3P84_02614 [Wallemia ichthyophaga]|nr:hypothetical protein E3P95_02678 [Wallemia ichthyophaga]TIA99104.1 hypothetical protein E3P94_02729 [Wallemia ichthyophaga]TIB32318.1 hypothetical protein E3P84_02614 [Wallemia ichthyophaga]TIB40930.1 hypothetical protein E3P83_02502 [Wallemia ichthyophaga]
MSFSTHSANDTSLHSQLNTALSSNDTHNIRRLVRLSALSSNRELRTRTWCHVMGVSGEGREGTKEAKGTGEGKGEGTDTGISTSTHHDTARQWFMLSSFNPVRDGTRLNLTTHFDLNKQDKRRLLTPHPDENQLRLDIDRSLIHYPLHVTLQHKNQLKALLYDLITTTLRLHPTLSYFQGFHDVITVILVELDVDVGVLQAFIHRFTLHWCRDAMGVGLEPVRGWLRVLHKILIAVDPDVAIIVEQAAPEPFFALSWILTLFAHDVVDQPTIARLFDFWIVEGPPALVYFCVALVMAEKERLVELAGECDGKDAHEKIDDIDNTANIHQFLAHIPKCLNEKLTQVMEMAMNIRQRFPLNHPLIDVDGIMGRQSVLRSPPFSITDRAAELAVGRLECLPDCVAINTRYTGIKSGPDSATINIALEHLQKHDLGGTGSTLPPTTFTLPPLQGPDIDNHFYRIGSEAAQPYLSLSRTFSASNLPPYPDSWVTDTPGWTVYDADGSYKSIQNGPSGESMLVFDVETLPHLSQHAVMAVAASPTHWYSWISPYLTGHSETTEHFIPLGESHKSYDRDGHGRPARPRIIIGHNVGFDRARLGSEYSLHLSSNRFIDTMSLHVAVRGMSSPQRPAWIAHQRDKKTERDHAREASQSIKNILAERDDPELLLSLMRYEREEREAQEALDRAFEMGEMGGNSSSGSGESESTTTDTPDDHKLWQDIASSNSLSNVYELYHPRRQPLEKEVRGYFTDPSSNAHTLRHELQHLMHYCAVDVQATHDVYSKVLPLFLDRCPHPVSFAGMLGMGNSFLPIDTSWREYLRKAEGKYRELSENVQTSLGELAQFARGKMDDESWRDDVWLAQLDWTPKRTRGVRRGSGSGSRRETVSTYIPSWLAKLLSTRTASFVSSPTLKSTLLPYLLQIKYLGHPVVFTTTLGWAARVRRSSTTKGEEQKSIPLKEGDVRYDELQNYYFLPLPGLATGSLISRLLLRLVKDGSLTSILKQEDLLKVFEGYEMASDYLISKVALDSYLNSSPDSTESPEPSYSPTYAQLKELDWTPAKLTPLMNKKLLEAAERTGVSLDQTFLQSANALKAPAAASAAQPQMQPKWYWDLEGKLKREEGEEEGGGEKKGKVQVSTRSKLSPILLKLRWLDYPVFHSRKHGYVYRVPRADISTGKHTTRQPTLSFKHPADDHLAGMESDFAFYKIPHKDGEEHNVGNLLSKGFIHALESGMLSSEDDTAHAAMSLNAQCSYWISARERVIKQFAVFDGTSGLDMGMKDGVEGGVQNGVQSVNFNESTRETTYPHKRGMILPEVITMGTITRRAIEKTWLTASNAKKNRVGSELKSMVKAPPGYAFVGADVDSEELWICSTLGDAQFGVQGATSIGWMTLEGTKNAGTDLHSVSAKILGISRDQAKVFNYSRIYGAGVKHAVQLLLKSNPSMSEAEAKQRATDLYAATKGMTMKEAFGRKFWFGGTESYVFNKLEEIALSDRPRTPTLGCEITAALAKKHLPSSGSNFMTSRVNWVVQSSGVDYLHMLIVSMDHLINKYKLNARYLISVHDEIRFLVEEKDKHRLALALQISNLWTRAMFTYKLGMDDLPMSVAFFSGVDVDHVFRKEVDMDCVTPSNLTPIEPGECLDIESILSLTSGSLMEDGSPMEEVPPLHVPALDGHLHIENHRPLTTHFLKAQSADSVSQIRMLEKRAKATASDEILQNTHTSHDIPVSKKTPSAQHKKTPVRKVNVVRKLSKP